MQGDYDILVFTEHGSSVGNATFSIIKPSASVYQTSTELLAFNQTTNENDESVISESTNNEPEYINAKKIPDWVKNIFVLYSYDEITENELINAITFLIDQGIIKISQ